MDAVIGNCIFQFFEYNTLGPRQNGRHRSDDMLKCVFLDENVKVSIKISLKFVRKVRFNNIPALVQTMARHRPGDKPLSEPMMVSLLRNISVTRPQWIQRPRQFTIVRVFSLAISGTTNAAPHPKTKSLKPKWMIGHVANSLMCVRSPCEPWVDIRPKAWDTETKASTVTKRRTLINSMDSIYS